MKKYFSLFFLPLLLLSSCEKSDPYTDPFGQGNNGSYTDTPVDPVTPDTTLGVSNEVAKDAPFAEVSHTKGHLLVILSKD